MKCDMSQQKRNDMTLKPTKIFVVSCLIIHTVYFFQNWEIQVYTNDPLNVYLRNGNLYLKPVSLS